MDEPKTKSLVKHDESLPFLLFDKLDDELILKELEGKLPDVLTYHFVDKGQEIWGLSKAGVDEATSELARSRGEVIRELEVHCEDKENEAMFTVKAGRFAVKADGTEVLLDTKFGFKRQAKRYPSGAENPFWFEQGSIKACRNACFRLLPKSVTQGIIEYARKQGKVQEVRPEPIADKGGQRKTKNYDFLEAMQKAKRALGEDKYYEILRDRYEYNHANEVTDPVEQENILQEMREAYKREKHNTVG